MSAPITIPGRNVMCDNPMDCLDINCKLKHGAHAISPCVDGDRCVDDTCRFLHRRRIMVSPKKQLEKIPVILKCKKLQCELAVRYINEGVLPDSPGKFRVYCTLPQCVENQKMINRCAAEFEY